MTTPDQLAAQDIAALRRWPRMLALAFMRDRITFQEFCDAQDAYEVVLRRLINGVVE
jgi:hypothetical protein